MATDVLDFSSIDAAVTAAGTAEVDTSEVDTTEVDTQGAEHTEEKVETPGELKTEEEKQADKEAKAAADKESASKSSPSKLRAALKAFRDADPDNNRAIATQLNDAIGRAEAFTKLFPSVKEATEFKTLLDTVGGREGITELQSTVEQIQASDAKLYSGDASLIDDIISDLRSENKLDALAKLGTPFLDKLLEVDPKGYAKAFAPHFVAGLKDANIPGALTAMVEAYKADDKEGLKKSIAGFVTWYNDLDKRVGEATKAPAVDPEREKFEKERNEFNATKQKEFKTEVMKACQTKDNSSVVKSLTPFLKQPFFKDFPVDTKQDIGKAVRKEVWDRLAGDKETQDQIKILMKKGDKDKIATYWSSRFSGLVDKVAKEIITKRYPGYAKTAPKVSSKAAPTSAAKFANTTPVRISAKPKMTDLDFSKDPNQHLFITGKGYLRSGKFVQWR
jgi:hypothetical protein